MRRHVAVIGLLAATALCAPVLAADMAPHPVLRGALPVTEQGQDWSGFYVGGFGGFNQLEFESRNAGVGLVRQMLNGSVFLNPGQADQLVTQKRQTSNGVGFGLYAGYNWMMEDYVLGLEADYTKGSLKGKSQLSRDGSFSVPDPSLPGVSYQYTYNSAATSDVKITDYGSIRARVGVPFGSFMPYATAGLAWARASYNNQASLAALTRTATQTTNALGVTTTTYTAWTPINNALKDSSRIRFGFGYALGLGADWALTQNVMLRAEVLHSRLGNVGDNGLTINQARAGAALKF
jgi:outer membrane immunogenic protein